MKIIKLRIQRFIFMSGNHLMEFIHLWQVIITNNVPYETLNTDKRIIIGYPHGLRTF